MHIAGHISNVAFTGFVRTSSLVLTFTALADIGTIVRKNLADLTQVCATWGPITNGITRVNGWIQVHPSAQTMVNSNLFKLFKSTIAPQQYLGAKNLLITAGISLVVAKALWMVANWMNNKEDTKKHYFSICEVVTGITMDESALTFAEKIEVVKDAVIGLLSEFKLPRVSSIRDSD